MTELNRADRKVVEGKVVSDKMDKTRVVEISYSKQEPKYGKILYRSTKLHAHDEKNEAKKGDRVRVMATRHISKRKCWRVTEILK